MDDTRSVIRTYNVVRLVRNGKTGSRITDHPRLSTSDSLVHSRGLTQVITTHGVSSLPAQDPHTPSFHFYFAYVAGGTLTERPTIVSE